VIISLQTEAGMVDWCWHSEFIYISDKLLKVYTQNRKNDKTTIKRKQ